MKNKIVYSLIAVFIFVSGLFLGARVGISTGASSNSTELYNSVIHLSSVYQQIEKGELESAKEAICRFAKTRVELLELGHTMLNDAREEEVANLKKRLETMFSKTSQEGCI